MAKKSSLVPLLSKLQPNGFKILADILATSKGDLLTRELGYEFKKLAATVCATECAGRPRKHRLCVDLAFGGLIITAPRSRLDR